MAVYFVTGKLGSGKTLCTVGKIQEYLESGRRVATNLDIDLGAMMPSSSKTSITRLPDKPRLEDLQLLGQGCEEENESKYGCLVLDELGSWFNSREWRDKERLPVIDWFLHSRKSHWDIYFIVQDIDSIDGQLVGSLCEHLVCCYRTDRLSIPIIGSMLNFIGFSKVMPKIHVATVYYGTSKSGLKVCRWWYRARDLYRAYNTAQKFKVDFLIDAKNDVITDMRAVYTVLSSSYLHRIDLLKSMQKELDSWKPGQGEHSTRFAKIGSHASLSRFPLSQVAIALICVVLSIYGFTRSKPVEAVIPVVEPVVLPVEDKIIKLNVEPPVVPDLDYFRQLIAGKPLHVSSFYSDGYKVQSIIKIGSGDSLESITLDDLRALGYVSTVNNKILTIAKNGYKLVLQLP